MRFCRRKQHIRFHLTSKLCPAPSNTMQTHPGDLTAKISNLGYPEATHSCQAHLSPDTLRRKQRHSADKSTLVEHILQAFTSSGIGPTFLSQQHVSQQNSSNKIIMCMEVGRAATTSLFWCLTRVAIRSSAAFRGWFGLFTSEQNEIIYRIFEDYEL